MQPWRLAVNIWSSNEIHVETLEILYTDISQSIASIVVLLRSPKTQV